MMYKGFQIIKHSKCCEIVNKKLTVFTTNTFIEAVKSIDEITALTDYIDWYKTNYGGICVVTEPLIREFITGVKS